MLYIRSGTVLQELTSTRDAVPISAIASLIGLGFLSLIPIFFRKRLQAKLE